MLAPATARELEIRIGASTRLPDGYVPEAARMSVQALMLRRWLRFGRKENDGTTYGGCPLPAPLWRTVGAALRQDPALLSRRADVVANRFRALAPRDDDTCVLWEAPHRRAVVTLLRRLEQAGILARLLRRDAPVPHLLLHQARGGRYPALFLVDVLMPRARALTDRCAVLKAVRVPPVSAGIIRMRDRGLRDEGWLTREEEAEVEAAVALSVDEHMERWARSLLIAIDGEVRRLTEEEVQAIAHAPDERARTPRRR